MRVQITMEKTLRVAKEYDVTQEELEQLRSGVNPFYDDLESELDGGDVEYDYAVTDEYGDDIVPWH